MGSVQAPKGVQMSPKPRKVAEVQNRVVEGNRRSSSPKVSEPLPFCRVLVQDPA